MSTWKRVKIEVTDKTHQAFCWWKVLEYFKDLTPDNQRTLLPYLKIITKPNPKPAKRKRKGKSNY